MTLMEYKAHVAELERAAVMAKRYAEETGQAIYWDRYYAAIDKFRRAKQYLKKKECAA